MSIDSGPLPELLTVAEAAEVLKVSVTTVRRLQQKRQIAFHKVRGAIRFARSDVAAYLKRRRVGSIDQ